MRFPKNTVTPPIEFLQHHEVELVLSDTAGRPAIRVKDQQPLDRHYSRGLINDDQHQAGNWLRHIYYGWAGSAVKAKNYDHDTLSRSQYSPQEYHAICWATWSACLSYIGSQNARIVRNYIIEEFTATQIAKVEEAPRNERMELLRQALDAVYDYKASPAYKNSINLEIDNRDA